MNCHNTFAYTLYFELVEGKLFIELNEEPGTEKEITIDISSTVPWARLYIGAEKGFNTYKWEQYVKRAQLKLPIKLQLLVPGCLPATTFAISMTGTYSGGVCDEATCPLELPKDKIQFTTSKPNVGQLNISNFNVIPGKWTPNPIKMTISHQLFQPEVLTVTPKSLETGALQFQAQASSGDKADNEMTFSWSRKLFGKMAFMYVYAKKNLALGKTLQVQFYLKCEQCNFNQFFPELAHPLQVRVEAQEKQRFIPFYIPSMKTAHKYCFNLKLNSEPIEQVTVVLSVTCSAFHVEPKSLTFDKFRQHSRQQSFCITPKIADQSCQLIFLLPGQGSSLYHTPQPLSLYSTGHLNFSQANFQYPSIIEATNRMVSDMFVFQFDKTDYADITLTPIFKPEKTFFLFKPSQFEVSHLFVDNFMHFTIIPNVDCPLRLNDTNMSVYWIIDWNITGSIEGYNKPHPMYIKVIENDKESKPQMDWCPQSSIDCSNPPEGMTCFPDQCVLDPKKKECNPLYIWNVESGYGFKQYAIFASVGLLVIYIILRQIGCLGNPQLPTIDEEKEIQEKRIFNTAENLREAQVAIENLLWQIYRYEVWYM